MGDCMMFYWIYRWLDVSLGIIFFVVVKSIQNSFGVCIQNVLYSHSTVRHMPALLVRLLASETQLELKYLLSSTCRHASCQ